MRRTLAALAVSLGFIASADADEVVLTSGRTLSGHVQKESDAEVVVDIGGGTLTFARSLVREIRRDPASEGTKSAEDAKPPAPAPDPTAKRDDRTKKPDAPATCSTLLAQMEKLALKPWEEPSPVTEKVAGKYKVVRARARVEMLQELPESPDGIEKVYVLSAVAGDAPNESGQFVWIPMHWSPIEKRWADGTFEEERFDLASSAARLVIERCCSSGSEDEGAKAIRRKALGVCDDDASDLKRAIQARDAAAPFDRYSEDRRVSTLLSKLLQDAIEAMGSPLTGADLAHCLEAQARIDAASKPAEKIGLVQARRVALYALVRNTGR
jgi:hypothetical protein